MKRREARPHNVAADCGRGHQRANGLANPTHPKELAQWQPIRFWEEHPPGNRIEKQWNEMEDNDSQNSPFTRSKRIQDLPNTLVNQKNGK